MFLSLIDACRRNGLVAVQSTVEWISPQDYQPWPSSGKPTAVVPWLGVDMVSVRYLGAFNRVRHNRTRYWVTPT